METQLHFQCFSSFVACLFFPQPNSFSYLSSLPTVSFTIRRNCLQIYHCRIDGINTPCPDSTSAIFSDFEGIFAQALPPHH